MMKMHDIRLDRTQQFDAPALLGLAERPRARDLLQVLDLFGAAFFEPDQLVPIVRVGGREHRSAEAGR